MSDVDKLLDRIDAEVDAAKSRVREFQQERVAEYEERQKRLETFADVCGQLREIWSPRLNALAERFGKRVDVKPKLTPQMRQATMLFHSQLAKIVLTLTATSDSEVRNLVLLYDLEILPILMKFKNADRLEMPLDHIDPQAVGNWIDDRILDFVKAYLELHQNQQYISYLKNYTVEDPIAGIRFPKYAAAAHLDWDGKTWYFIGEETLAEFRKQKGITG